MGKQVRFPKMAGLDEKLSKVEKILRKLKDELDPPPGDIRYVHGNGYTEVYRGMEAWKDQHDPNRAGWRYRNRNGHVEIYNKRGEALQDRRDGEEPEIDWEEFSKTGKVIFRDQQDPRRRFVHG